VDRVTPGKGPPVPIVQEVGWASELVWTQRLEETKHKCRMVTRDILTGLLFLSYTQVIEASNGKVSERRFVNKEQRSS
jgi:hypothetical protein